MTKKPTTTQTTAWLDKLFEGDRLALARAASAVENETPQARFVLAAIQEHLGGARIIGITGSPGVGKSTLVSRLVAEYRAGDARIGVIAVDPSSPLSGGAILGDRLRMAEHAGDSSVFVRSLASRGHLGGLSRTASRVADVMDAAGCDLVVIETVGAGQSEVEIAELVQTRIVVCAPGQGDEIQAVKAGILEIADILVLNKGDFPQSATAAAQLEEAVRLQGKAGWRAPVVITSALNGSGLSALRNAVEDHGNWLNKNTRPLSSLDRVRNLLANLAGDMVRDHLRLNDDESLELLCRRVARGEIDFEEAAAQALGYLESSEP